MEEKKAKDKMLPNFIYGGLAKEEDALDVLAINQLSGNDVIDRFAELVYRKGHQSVKYYANAMEIPYEYFSGMIISITSMKPSHWIDEYVYLAAVDLLKETDMKINEISDRLGFTSANVFSRYCKRMNKKSPYKLRHNVNYHFD